MKFLRVYEDFDFDWDEDDFDIEEEEYENIQVGNYVRLKKPGKYGKSNNYFSNSVNVKYHLFLFNADKYYNTDQKVEKVETRNDGEKVMKLETKWDRSPEFGPSRYSDPWYECKFWTNTLNTNENFDFDEDDFDFEEEDDNISIGDKVYLPPNEDNIETSEYYYTGNSRRQRGKIDGKYKTFKNKYGLKGTVDEIQYRDDGTKLIRFVRQWPFRVATNYVKLTNEKFDFEEDDFEEEQPDSFDKYLSHNKLKETKHY